MLDAVPIRHGATVAIWWRGALVGSDFGAAEGAIVARWDAPDEVSAVAALVRTGQTDAARAFLHAVWPWVDGPGAAGIVGVPPAIVGELWGREGAQRRATLPRARRWDQTLPRVLRYLAAEAERGNQSVPIGGVLSAMGDAWAARVTKAGRYTALFARLAQCGHRVDAAMAHISPTGRAAQHGRCRGVSFDKRTEARLVALAASRAVPVSSVVRVAVARYLASVECAANQASEH